MTWHWQIAARCAVNQKRNAIRFPCRPLRSSLYPLMHEWECKYPSPLVQTRTLVLVCFFARAHDPPSLRPSGRRRGIAKWQWRPRERKHREYIVKVGNLAIFHEKSLLPPLSFALLNFFFSQSLWMFLPVTLTHPSTHTHPVPKKNNALYF